MRKISSFIIFSFWLVSFLSAQQHLSVPLGDPVYELIEMAEIKGILKNIPQARPYTLNQVMEYLSIMESQSNRLNSLERKVVNRTKKRLGREKAEPLRDGVITVSEHKELPFRLRFKFRTNNKFEFQQKDLYTFNNFEVNFEGNIKTFLSYNLMFGGALFYDRQTAFLPYSYTKEYDSEPIGSQSASKTPSPDELFTGFVMGTQVNTSFMDDKIQAGIAYMRRDFGVGNGSLIYSGTAQPMLGVDLKMRPVEWFGFNYASGSLFGNTTNFSGSRDAMFTVQQGEFFVAPWFYFNITPSVVWVKRFEPLYLFPLLPTPFVQGAMGDFDNLALSGEFAFKFLSYFKIHGSLFLDEVSPSSFFKDAFSNIRQLFAFQAGIEIVLPYLPFTTGAFQYTRIEPYVYSHYRQAYPSNLNDRIANISFMNNGENLGYSLQPNSDEFLVKIESLPFPGFSMTLQYQHIRHGHGDRMKGEIEGYTESQYLNTEDDRTSIYEKDYFDGEKIPEKSFLNDGVYEYIHSIGISATYYFADFPLSLTGGYGFSHIQNAGNISGETEMRHIASLCAVLYY